MAPTKEQTKHVVEVEAPIISHTYKVKDKIPVVTDQHSYKMMRCNLSKTWWDVENLWSTINKY